MKKRIKKMMMSVLALLMLCGCAPSREASEMTLSESQGKKVLLNSRLFIRGVRILNEHTYEVVKRYRASLSEDGDTIRFTLPDETITWTRKN